VVECVCQGFNFLFTLTDLAIKLITVPLQFLTLLSSFNHKVSLSVLAISFNVAGGGLVPHDESFILDPEVLDTLTT
jgi:hypothetical protein